jgi:hypothetical protein
MALIEATQRALELQPLVGKELNHGLKIRAILPAPVEEPLFNRFILAVKDETPNVKIGSLYSDIAEIIDAHNFEVAVLFDSELPKTVYEMPIDIKWEWYKIARNY